MTADDSVDPTIAEGTDRRTAVKKAAIAAGVVAWTTPAVQAVTARPAFAQTITACAPELLPHPGIPDRPELQALPGGSSASELLQRQHLFLAIEGHLRWRAARGTPPWAIIEIAGGTKPGNCKSERFLDDACKTSTVTITSAKVTCPDGKDLHDHQSGRPDHVYRLLPLLTAAELSTSDVIEGELIEQPSDTVAAEGGATNRRPSNPRRRGRIPRASNRQSPFPPEAEPSAAGGESPPAGGEPPGDTPGSGSSP